MAGATVAVFQLAVGCAAIPEESPAGRQEAEAIFSVTLEAVTV